jgi:uncharacterized protein
MNSFTEGLAMEFQSIGSPVKVQALCPGYTLSEFHDVAGVDRSRIPARFWMRAEDVVRVSLREFGRGVTIVVPGWQYRTAVFFMAHLPRAWMRRNAVRQQRRLGRD